MQPSPFEVEGTSAGSTTRKQAGDRWRLTIGHLLVVTATTGAVLAMLQTWNPYYEDSGSTEEYQRILWTQWFIHRLFAPVYGVVLAGSAICLWRLVTGHDGYPNQPGHWLFLVLAPWAVVLPIMESTGYVPPPLELATFVFLIVGTGAAALKAGLQPRRDANEVWRFAFLLLALAMGGMLCAFFMAVIENSATLVVVMMFAGVSAIGVGISVISAFMAIVSDLFAGDRRDALHWIGVVSLLLLSGHVTSLILMAMR